MRSLVICDQLLLEDAIDNVEGSKVVSVALPDSLIADIDRIAASDMCSRSSVVRRLVARGVGIINHREAHAERLRHAQDPKQEIEA
jgi:hypothetical protein